MTAEPRPGLMLSLLDYSENWERMVRYESQSMHWHHLQVSLLVFVVWSWEQVGSDWVLRKEWHQFFSTSKNKSSAFLVAARRRLEAYLRERGVIVKHDWMWSDNCLGQFKSRHALGACSLWESLFGCSLDRCFTCPGHGKSEPDAAGGHAKRACDQLMLQENADVELATVAELVAALNRQFSEPAAALGVRGPKQQAEQ